MSTSDRTKTAAEVLAEVRGWDAEFREWFEERAAILEFDANVPRGLAELIAYRSVRDHLPAKQQTNRRDEP